MIACGRVTSLRDGFTEVEMPPLRVGSAVRCGQVPGRIVEAGVSRALVTFDGDLASLAIGAIVSEDVQAAHMTAGIALLGRSIDAYGTPLDGMPPARGRIVPIAGIARPVAERRGISEALPTGVRAIDALLTIGRGARVGIFGGPGSGKTTLIESIAAGTAADAVVLALVGERGREAQRWTERCSERMTIVCETSDRHPARRLRAALAACAHAEALARSGLHVLLVLDSLARVAYALRELAAATNEPVGRGGYPARVFAQIAKLVERAGAFERGSITLIATVLNDGDDRDPVSENARSLLDGHLQLDPALAAAGRFPAIDVLASASRTMGAVASAAHRRSAQAVRSALARLAATRDLRSLGIEPADARLRADIAAEPSLEAFLCQDEAVSPFEQTLEALHEMADILEEPHEHHL